MIEQPNLAKSLFPLVAAIGISCGVTVALLTVFSYLSKPIRLDLGLSQTETAMALTLHLGMLIVALPAAGLLADRFGARPIIMVSSLLFGTCLVAISLVDTKAGLYAAFATAGLVGGGHRQSLMLESSFIVLRGAVDWRWAWRSLVPGLAGFFCP